EPAKQRPDLIRSHDVRPHKKTTRSTLTNLSERLDCRTLILEVVNRDVNAAFWQRESNSFSDSARTASDQRVFSLETHMNLLRFRTRFSRGVDVCKRDL